MPTKQIHSFLPYERGINPEDIRIGSLFLDVFNIEESREAKRFEYRQDLQSQAEYEEAIKPWSAAPQIDGRGGFGIDFELTDRSSMGVTFSQLIKTQGVARKSVTATLEGDSGRRLRIKKQDSFLRESVMKQKGIDKWIRTQASISRSNHHRRIKVPEIWMVTGVQLVTNGEVHTGSSRRVNGGVRAGADPGPLLGLAPGTAALRLDAGKVNNAVVNNHFGHDGERVWAAQFMQVTFEFGNALDLADESHPLTIASYDLEDIPDLNDRGLREDRPASPAPPLIGRITVTKEVESTTGEEFNDIKIDDQPYIKEFVGTNWPSYNECLKFLEDAEAERGSTS